jgi:hypothetical protein
VGVRLNKTAGTDAEELRLWADYYEAMQRALEILRRDGTAHAALSGILAQDTIARRAIGRIKQIHGIG